MNFLFLKRHWIKDTANLTIDFNAVVVFVNDTVDKPTLRSFLTIEYSLLHCDAGFNNVDIDAAKQEKALKSSGFRLFPRSCCSYALILTLNRKRKAFMP
jgi:lactate dehydrogenase-like 2-hydroxyacid dehydrogenase